MVQSRPDRLVFLRFFPTNNLLVICGSHHCFILSLCVHFFELKLSKINEKNISIGFKFSSYLFSHNSEQCFVFEMNCIVVFPTRVSGLFFQPQTPSFAHLNIQVHRKPLFMSVWKCPDYIIKNPAAHQIHNQQLFSHNHHSNLSQAFVRFKHDRYFFVSCSRSGTCLQNIIFRVEENHLNVRH